MQFIPAPPAANIIIQLENFNGFFIRYAKYSFNNNKVVFGYFYFVVPVHQDMKYHYIIILFGNGFLQLRVIGWHTLCSIILKGLQCRTQRIRRHPILLHELNTRVHGSRIFIDVQNFYIRLNSSPYPCTTMLEVIKSLANILLLKLCSVEITSYE